MNPRRGLAKVALEETGERLAMTSLVTSHLVNGIVDGIEVGSFGALGQVGLAGGCAVLSFNAELEVLLGGVGDNLAQKLGELGGVFGLLVSGLLIVKTDLGIALAEGDAAHGKIHADLGALTVEVGAQVLDDVLGNLIKLANANDVLGSPSHIAGLLGELSARAAALGALVILGQLIAVELFYITANGAYKLHVWSFQIKTMALSPALLVPLRGSRRYISIIHITERK
jgi:hypothetical protein